MGGQWLRLSSVWHGFGSQFSSMANLSADCCQHRTVKARMGRAPICPRECVVCLSFLMLLYTATVTALSNEQGSLSTGIDVFEVTTSGQNVADYFGNREEYEASDITPNSSVLSDLTNESISSKTSGEENLTAMFSNGPMMSNVTLTQHVISTKDCEGNGVIEIFGSSGEIHGISGSDVHNTTEVQCWVKIEVPEEMYVSAILHNLMVPACYSDLEMLIYDETFSTIQMTVNLYFTPSWISPVIFLASNKMYVGFINSFKETSELAKFRFRFQASKQFFQRSLSVVMTSTTSGHISPIGFNRHRHLLFLLSANASHTLHVPTDSVVMTSFPVLDIGSGKCDFDYMTKKWVELRVTNTNGTERTVWKICDATVMPVEIHYGIKTMAIDFIYTCCTDVAFKGFQMLYSFHPENDAPARLPGGLFNCSVPHYASFKQHVHCNLEQECQGGEDEGQHCPFSPPGCDGKVSYKDKCFACVRHDTMEVMYFEEAEAECRKRGGRLAMMKTQGEWEASMDLLRYGRLSIINAHFGMTTTEARMPDIYRCLTMWLDGTVAYQRTVSCPRTINEYKKMPSWYTEQGYGIAGYGRLENNPFMYSVCEFRAKPIGTGALLNEESSVVSNQTQNYTRNVMSEETSDHNFLSSVSNCLKSFEGVLWKESLCQSLREGLHPKLQSDHFIVCPLGHVTHDFLACVPDGQCGANYPLYSCTTPTGTQTITDSQSDSQTTDMTDIGGDVVTAMFVCENGRGTVHYTLLCDFRPDCEDGSDEAFCRHRQHCAGFTCTNGQCVGGDRRCDLVRNCVDGSDEDNCVGRFHSPNYKRLQCRILPPAIVDFAYGGYLIQKPMTDSDLCPDTHFQCPGEVNYCLPVYVRCNGVYDCAGHEDEADCDSYSCPGHYRCRGSSVCVHADHLCDGMAQCPKRDDELLCEEPECPYQCRCQGLAFVCPSPFPTERFPDLRYLDGTHSGLTFGKLTDQHYLVWLSLAQCGLQHLVRLELPSLQTLDLSDNLLTAITMETLHGLTNLRFLSLAGNPLAFLDNGNVNSVHQNLRRLDLSRTELNAFDSSVFRNFSQIRYLNLSFSTHDVISSSSFSFLPELTEIDLRGCPVTDFHVGLFSGLEELSVVFASSYKLCCEDVLPDGFDRSYCFAPEDEVSSCDHLLKSDVYRVLFWVMVTLTVFFNACSCVVSLFLNRSVKSNPQTMASSDSNLLCPLPPSTQLNGEQHVVNPLSPTAPSTQLRGGCCGAKRVKRDEQPSHLCCQLFLVNLNVADFLMGISLAIVASADVLFSGQYCLYDNQWRNTVSCATAGCLAVVSFSVSAFTVCLITLERCAAISSDSLTFHHLMASEPSSARMACLLSWIFGISLAGSPFFWQTSDSRFYGGTALCVPVLSGIQFVTGRRYYLGAVLVANFILCCISAVGLVCLDMAWRKLPVTLEETKMSQAVTISRRFIMVVTSNVVCWMVVCLVGFLEYGGVFISGEVTSFVNMILIPVNAALNPCLYLLSLHAEKQRQKTRERLLKVLKSRVISNKGHSR